MAPSSRATVGYSQQPIAFEAGRDAASQAAAGHDSDGEEAAAPVVAIVYGTVAYEQEELLRGVRSVLPGVPLVGGSSQGVVRSGDASEVDRAVGVALIRSRTITCRTAEAGGVGADSEGAGRRLGRALRAEGAGGGTAGDDPIFLWYEALTGVNVEALLRGLAEEGFPCVVGGATGQPWGPISRTYQYLGDRVLDDSVVALRLDGTGGMIFDATHGTEPIGLEVTITGARDNVITTIDGQPALDVWHEQMGAGEMGNVDNIANWALGVSLPPEAARHYEGPVTRSVFSFNRERREVVLQAPIPEGTRAVLCHRTTDAVYDRALRLAERLHDRLDGKTPLLVLSFECGGRPGPFLGDVRARDEAMAMQERIGASIPWLGMYAWGEIFPVAGRSYFHNYTLPVCVVLAP